MPGDEPRSARLRTVLLLCSLLFGHLPADAASIGPQPGSKPQQQQQTAAAGNPRWSELSPAQQQALAPLAGEWDKLDAFRKKKWLAIGNRYASMKPDQQQRVHERMRDWIRLTPEQRRVARENYARAKKLNPDQKSARWEQYQQLPEEQKQKLASDVSTHKRVATLPPPSAQNRSHKTLPPIKAASKPLLERSVTPEAASHSAIQPSATPQTSPQK